MKEMTDETAQGIAEYADNSAKEIWDDLLTHTPTWEDHDEFWDAVVDRVESYSYSPIMGMHPNLMYELIEVRLWNRYLGRGSE